MLPMLMCSTLPTPATTIHIQAPAGTWFDNNNLWMMTGSLDTPLSRSEVTPCMAAALAGGPGNRSPGGDTTRCVQLEKLLVVVIPPNDRPPVFKTLWDTAVRDSFPSAMLVSTMYNTTSRSWPASALAYFQTGLQPRKDIKATWSGWEIVVKLGTWTQKDSTMKKAFLRGNARCALSNTLRLWLQAFHQVMHR